MAARAERMAPGLEQSLDRDLVSAAHAEEDFLLLVAAGVADPHLEHEPVELRLGQRVGALVLDRVLRRQHHERLVQREGGAADGDLVLLHRLQQRGLDLGRGAVDLVGQDDLGEERPLLDVEVLGLLVEDHGADQVGREQVGGELDPGERGVDDLGQRAHGERLGQPGHPLQQDVPAGEEPDEQPLDHGVLPDDAARYLFENAGDRQRLRWHFRQLRRAHARGLLGVDRGKIVGVGGVSPRGAGVVPEAAPAHSERWPSGIVAGRRAVLVGFIRRRGPSAPPCTAPTPPEA